MRGAGHLAHASRPGVAALKWGIPNTFHLISQPPISTAPSSNRLCDHSHEPALAFLVGLLPFKR